MFGAFDSFARARVDLLRRMFDCGQNIITSMFNELRARLIQKLPPIAPSTLLSSSLFSDPSESGVVGADANDFSLCVGAVRVPGPSPHAHRFTVWRGLVSVQRSTCRM